MSERDTHFQGFAERQWNKMFQDSVLSKMLQDLADRAGPHVDLDILMFEQRMKTLLAQSAYDLVAHTILNIDPYHLDALPHEEIPARIPDMTEWPVEPK